MDITEAIKLIADFKSKGLQSKLSSLQKELQGKSKNDIIQLPPNIYEVALEIKEISSQIDEIVHATGIIQCLPLILKPNEIIEKVSLGAGAGNDSFDVVTDKRIAEFKFSRWQAKSNGQRNRLVFADFVKLLLADTNKTKELYVFNRDIIISFLQSKKASWKKVLSKSGGLDIKLDHYLKTHQIDATYLNEIYQIQPIEIIDIDTILKIK
jgi:hypothetical protein